MEYLARFLGLISHLLLLRTVGLRKSAGKWIAEPQDIYDALAEHINKAQVQIEDLFWLQDEKLSFGCMVIVTQESERTSFTVPDLMFYVNIC